MVENIQNAQARFVTTPSPPNRMAALIVCILSFLSLGVMVRFITHRQADVEPLALTVETIPKQIGKWHFQGQREGWATAAYPAGGTLYEYVRNDGAVMLMSAGISQKRDKTFANIPTTHLRRGHELIRKLRVTVGPGPDGRTASANALFYSGTAAESPLCFLGIYLGERRLVTDLATIKATVTWHMAAGDPEAWVAAYFGRVMKAEDDPEIVATETAEFATAAIATLEKLRESYGASRNKS